MKYFEMLQIIYDNNLEISFRKSRLGGIRVEVSKTVGDKLLKQNREITREDYLTGNNNYISGMVVSILSAEKELTLQQSKLT